MKYYIGVLMLFSVLLSKGQQADIVDFKRVEAVVFFNQVVVDSTAFSSYDITFDILKDTDSIYLDAVDMRFMNVALDNKEVRYDTNGKQLIIYHDFKANRSHSLSFLFFAAPKKAMYFIGWENEAPNQIWTQGQGKYTSHWLPSSDDMNEKIEFDLTFAAPKGYKVISNGRLINKSESPSYNLWQFDMQKPMSSYLVAVVVGHYDFKTEWSESDIPLEMYYYPEDSLKFEPTYRHTKDLFDYLEQEIGVAYPWQNYKQIPVHDFLYAGMENTGTTIFSDDYVIDAIAFNDRNYVNVNAHELAHQWFGNLVTAKSGTHHWLQEGFATYYALLAERAVFGDPYFYWELYKSAQQLTEQDRLGNGTSLLDPNSSSLTFYHKGAWTIFMLRELIGDSAFRATVQEFLTAFQFDNADTSDFIRIAEAKSGMDLTEFYNEWFVSTSFPIHRAMDALEQNSPFIQEYVMVDCDVKTSKCHDYLMSGISDEAKVKLIAQNPSLVTKDVFANGLKVRQAIAQHLTDIPTSVKNQYESLLKDKSYVTIESALYNLWINFPEERAKYLEQTKNIIGFNDHNIRILWLVLHLNTLEYQTDKKEAVYNELLNYTSDYYNAQTRMTAFNYLDMMKACNTVCKENLQKATSHHNWQLTKFARSFLERLED